MSSIIKFSIAAAALAAGIAVYAQHCGMAQAEAAAGCCARPATAPMDCCAKAPPAAVKSNLPSALQPVMNNYAKIQAALAADSTQRVADNAAALAKLMRDSGSIQLAEGAPLADALARAQDLKTARAAFGPLSTALIQYLSVGGLIPGEYREAYCPMAKAGWLQRGDTISNPYMGKDMLRCGHFKA